jgi:hypothetical protein
MAAWALLLYDPLVRVIGGDRARRALVPVLYEAMATVFDRPGRPATTARLLQSS